MDPHKRPIPNDRALPIIVSQFLDEAHTFVTAHIQQFENLSERPKADREKAIARFIQQIHDQLKPKIDRLLQEGAFPHAEGPDYEKINDFYRFLAETGENAYSKIMCYFERCP
jgi:hypothetical protein